MTQFLPSNLLALFAPREPLKFLPPAGKLPHEKNFPPYTGIAAFLSNFEAAKDVPPPTRGETKDERRERQQKERAEQIAYKLEQDLAMWDPSSDSLLTSDPFKTLFCSRINYDTSESKLRREFDVYGPVKKVTLVLNSETAKPRGYAFVEFEHERDMHAAYKHADGKKIDSRRIIVDVERGRTVKGWRPRRLGGGLGNTRRGGKEENTRYSGREDFVGRERDVPEGRKGLESREDYPRGGSPSDRGGPRRSRSRDRNPPIRRRSRTPRGGERADRERDARGERRRRAGSRERAERRRGSAEKEPLVKKEPLDEIAIKSEIPGDEGDNKESIRKRIRRSRSPRTGGVEERGSERRRSRSRDRKRSRRSRSRERRGGSKQRDRPRRTAGGGEAGSQAAETNGSSIKQELDNLNEYQTSGDAGGVYKDGNDEHRGRHKEENVEEEEPHGNYNRLEDI